MNDSNLRDQRQQILDIYRLLIPTQKAAIDRILKLIMYRGRNPQELKTILTAIRDNYVMPKEPQTEIHLYELLQPIIKQTLRKLNG